MANYRDGRNSLLSIGSHCSAVLGLRWECCEVRQVMLSLRECWLELRSEFEILHLSHRKFAFDSSRPPTLSTIISHNVEGQERRLEQRGNEMAMTASTSRKAAKLSTKNIPAFLNKLFACVGPPAATELPAESNNAVEWSTTLRQTT